MPSYDHSIPTQRHKMPTPTLYRVRGKAAYFFRFKNPTTNGRTKIKFGVVQKNFAIQAGQHIDTLIESCRLNTDFPPQLEHWLKQLPDELYDKLARAGLVGERPTAESYQLGPFLDNYYELRSTGRGDWAASTAVKRKQSINDLEAYFGADHSIGEISSDDARRWLNWLTDDAPGGRNLAPASASKKVKDARQFFANAVEMELIARNPFQSIKLPRQDNPNRLRYVNRETVERVLAEIDDPEMRLVVALGRYAGLRIPSEAQALLWSDFNDGFRYMRIRSRKKAGDATAGQRECPVFQELLPFLDPLKKGDIRRNSNVLKKLNDSKNSNLRTSFKRAIKRSGVEPWPRVFQNLRASALTDLAERNPLPTVCKWLGNSVRVAEKHYFMLKGVALSHVSGQEGTNLSMFGPQNKSGSQSGTTQGDSA
ncbi:tyrosine-type recombinase/integrase [Rhodopirellula europaea]